MNEDRAEGLVNFLSDQGYVLKDEVDVVELMNLEDD